VKKQTIGPLTDGVVYEFTYTTDTNGKIIQTDVKDPRGTIRQVTFNSSGYTLSDTRAWNTPLQQITSYQRQTTGHFIHTVTDPTGENPFLIFGLLFYPLTTPSPANAPGPGDMLEDRPGLVAEGIGIACIPAAPIRIVGGIGGRAAIFLVDDILTTPGSTIQNSFRGRFGNTIEVTAPDGRGIVFDVNGKFLFFKE